MDTFEHSANFIIYRPREGGRKIEGNRFPKYCISTSERRGDTVVDLWCLPNQFGKEVYARKHSYVI